MLFSSYDRHEGVVNFFLELDLKSLRISVLAIFLIYSVVQAAGKNFSIKGEYFPFFSWSLFTEVRNEVTSITIEVTRIGDIEYSPPRNYYLLPDLSQDSARRTSSPYKAAWGLLEVLNDQQEFEKRLKSFNVSFFKVPEEVEYQIAAESYDPIEKWKTGAIKNRWIALGNLRKGPE